MEKIKGTIDKTTKTVAKLNSFGGFYYFIKYTSCKNKRYIL